MSDAFPHDPEFQDVTLTKVKGDREKGWEATRDDHWCFWIGPESPVEPKAGSTVRLYGAKMGVIRGLWVDGHKVFYRTAAEDRERSEIQVYGADAADWLARWDGGDSVWSIEMGGFGPGYEQAIQITTAEILRHLLARRYDAGAWVGEKRWEADSQVISDALMPVVAPLGLSGAQWGAALSLAVKLYRDGPRKVMRVKNIKDRHIQISRNFPSLTKAA